MLSASESWLFLFLLSRRPVEFWSLSGNRRNPPGGKPQTHGESDSFSSMTVQTTYDSYWISSLGRRYVCRPYYVISCPSAAYKSLTQMKREKNNGNLWNIFPSTKTQNSALPCNNWMWSLISVLCRIPIKKTPQQLHFTMSQTCVHCWCFYLFMSRKKNEEEATMPSSHKVDIAVVNTRIMLQTF